MNLIEWNEKFSVKIKEIDDQHREMIDIINDLFAGMNDGRPQDLLNDTFDRLETYTKSHFATEERYFQKFNYPAADEHIEEHLTFTHKLEQFRDDFRRGNPALSLHFMNFFLGDWLRHHILKVDRNYTDHFIANGLR